MTKPEPAPRLGSILPPTGVESKQETAARYEEQIIDVLCRHYFGGAAKKEKARLCSTMSSRTETHRPTLALWHDQYPSFPLYLGSAVIPHLAKDSTISKLFNSFGDRKFVKAYDNLLEDIPSTAEGLPVGLVFRWPHLAGPGSAPTGLVLHNRSVTRNVPGVRMLWVTKKSVLTVEPLSILLASIDKDWAGRKWAPEDD